MPPEPNNTELEAQVMLQLETNEKLDDLATTSEAQVVEQTKTTEAVKDLDKSAEAVIKILDEIRDSEIVLDIKVNGEDVNKYTGPQGDKGPKGDKGDTVVGPPGKEGKEGYTPIKGKDYFTSKDRAEFLNEIKSLIRPGKNGRDGRDGDTPTIDYDYIIETVKSLIPTPKNGKNGSPDTPEEVLNKIKGKLSWKDLKDRPDFSLGGTGYLRELSDMAVQSITNGQSIKWNSTTNKWEAYTPSTGSSDTFITNEVVSGSGTSFVLANTPIVGTVKIFGAGQRLTPGVGNDYTISGKNITLLNSYSAGQILADYQI